MTDNGEKFIGSKMIKDGKPIIDLGLGQDSSVFDRWAERYDASVESPGFPFEGYNQVLDAIVEETHAKSGMSVLELGTGTGNLAARFAELGCVVWATDYSERMLEQARFKVPTAQFVKTDLRSYFWPFELPPRFQTIVCAYVIHEFDFEHQAFLLRLWEDHILAEGRIVIGDISFPTAAEREAAHQQYKDVWDEDEHYLAADQIAQAAQEIGLQTAYRQISFCAGVYTLTRSNEKAT